MEKGRRRVSTIDVTGHGELTLVVGENGTRWADAARRVAREFRVGLPVRAIGTGCEYHDVLREWTQQREVGDDGALLVRPDHHVAWRSMAMVDDPVTALRTALATVLARSVPEGTRRVEALDAQDSLIPDPAPVAAVVTAGI